MNGSESTRQEHMSALFHGEQVIISIEKGILQGTRDIIATRNPLVTGARKVRFPVIEKDNGSLAGTDTLGREVTLEPGHIITAKIDQNDSLSADGGNVDIKMHYLIQVIGKVQDDVLRLL